MRYLIAAMAAAASFAVSAAPVAVFDGDTVKVYAYAEACDVPSLSVVLGQFTDTPRKAAVIYQGREIKACYAVQGDTVLVMDQDGDGGTLPAAAFKEAKGA
jgi:hypothetical protein